MQIINNKIEGSAYVIGPYKNPVANVKSGEIFQIQTLDAFGNKVDSSTSDITKLIQMPFVNPLVGPIYIEGAQKGDSLAVTIISIETSRDYGVSAIIPEFG